MYLEEKWHALRSTRLGHVSYRDVTSKRVLTKFLGLRREAGTNAVFEVLNAHHWHDDRFILSSKICLCRKAQLKAISASRSSKSFRDENSEDRCSAAIIMRVRL